MYTLFFFEDMNISRLNRKKKKQGTDLNERIRLSRCSMRRFRAARRLCTCRARTHRRARAKPRKSFYLERLHSTHIRARIQHVLAHVTGHFCTAASARMHVSGAHDYPV